MQAEGVLPLGSSSLFADHKLVSLQNAIRRSPHPEKLRMNFSNRAGRAVACEFSSNLGSSSPRRRGNVSGMLHSKQQTVTNALSLRESEQSGPSMKSLTTYIVSAESIAETLSNPVVSSHRGTSTNEFLVALAGAPVGASGLNAGPVDGKEARIRQLEALAVLRQGRLLGETQVFRQTYVIRSYEVSAEGTTNIDTILSLFQEVALNHVSLLGIAGDGFGATRAMNKNRLIWVVTRLHVEIDRYPAWPEVVEIDTWVGAAGKNGMRRDWLLREHATGKVIAKGTSTWVMMNKDTRRLSKIPDDVKAEIVPVFIEEYAIANLAVDRIPKVDNNAQNILSNLTSCRADLDVNQHINNVTYVRWVMEGCPPSTLETHQVSSVTLEYRRECKKDDIVESLTDGHTKSCSTIANETVEPRVPDLQYTHLLRMQCKGEEIVRGRTVWKAKRKLLQ